MKTLADIDRLDFEPAAKSQVVDMIRVLLDQTVQDRELLQLKDAQIQAKDAVIRAKDFKIEAL
ncbi:hypothetical protein, partial [Methylocucumis oryzae]